MRHPGDSGRYLDSVVVVFLFAALLFLPPLLTAWATPNSPWFLPYLVWLGVIALIGLVQWVYGRHEL